MIKECFGLDNKEALKKFNLKLNYDDILHFNCEKINKNSYSVILAGPMPHSAPGKSDSSSVLANLEKKIEYPKIPHTCVFEFLCSHYVRLTDVPN